MASFSTSNELPTTDFAAQAVPWFCSLLQAKASEHGSLCFSLLLCYGVMTGEFLKALVGSISSLLQSFPVTSMRRYCHAVQHQCFGNLKTSNNILCHFKNKGRNLREAKADQTVKPWSTKSTHQQFWSIGQTGQHLLTAGHSVLAQSSKRGGKSCCHNPSFLWSRILLEKHKWQNTSMKPVGKKRG